MLLDDLASNGWSGKVERDTLLLDSAEDCGAGLRWFGYDFGLATISWQRRIRDRDTGSLLSCMKESREGRGVPGGGQAAAVRAVC